MRVETNLNEDAVAVSDVAAQYAQDKGASSAVLDVMLNIAPGMVGSSSHVSTVLHTSERIVAIVLLSGVDMSAAI